MPAPKLQSRQQALDLGEITYVGSPCRNGHAGVRYTKSAHCVECQKNHYRRWKDKLGGNFRQAIRERQRKWVGLPDPTRKEPKHCECCGKKCTRALALDHDHKTEKFRGWLCAKCNMGIGLLGDNISGVQNALDYLRKK